MKSIKLVILKSFIVIFFAFNATSSFSQSLVETNFKVMEENKVQFAGIVNEFLIFDLKLYNLPAKGCTLRIFDDTGNIVFEDAISGNEFARRYKVLKDGISKINFKASGKGFMFNQSFNIRTEEILVVTTE